MKRLVVVAAFAMVGLSGCGSPADDVGPVQATFSVTSEDFADGMPMPQWATANALGGQCTGDNTSPQLSWESPSTSTAVFVLTMIDTDARDFVHWMLADIPASTGAIDRGASDSLGSVGGKSSLSQEYDGKYFGPCPPGPNHHYVFTVYALDEPLGLEPGFTLGELKDAMSGHILAQGSLTGVRSGPA